MASVRQAAIQERGPSMLSPWRSGVLDSGIAGGFLRRFAAAGFAVAGGRHISGGLYGPGPLPRASGVSCMTESTGPLAGLRVFDLTRVLAGPTCVQMLVDLGADVIKIERPGAGDDTRGFAPPYMPDTKESAYFVGVNRNKRSVTLDIAQPEGQEIAQRLIAESDILVENFKVGALAKYGLGYAQLHAKYPRLIYCSITGFGQTGP